jgi:hypothetical protein
LKVLEESIGNVLSYTDIGNNFLNRTPIAQVIRTRIVKLIASNLKLLHSKGNIYHNEKTEWEKICQLFIWQGINIQNIKELKKLHMKRTNNLTNKWVHKLNIFQKKKYKWPINTWKMFKICSHKGNANLNYIEVPSNPSHNGYHQENKQQILARM